MAIAFPNTLPGVVAIVLGALVLQYAFILIVWKRRRTSICGLLAQNEQRLALIGSIAGFGLWHWEAVTDHVWASVYTRGLFGLAEGEPLTRQAVLDALHPADRTALLQEIRNRSYPREKADHGHTADQNDTVQMDLRIVTQDSEARWISVKACALRDASGSLVRAAGYVTDDGQRNLVSAELLKQQQKLTHLTRVALLGELSGALAHELQQPLTAILCNAQAAQLLTAQDQFNVEELREILREIVDADKNAGQIISRLRALLVRGETQFQRVEIGALVRDVLVLAHGTLMERNVQVNARIDDVIPSVEGDRVELQQVLLNLVLNASESMSTNPARDRRIEIVATLDSADGMVRTSVLDCGRGINVDQLAHLFDPFFTTKQGGLGLGLAISHSIIAAHKGRLWAANRSDRGAAFHFTLPVVTTEGKP